MVRVIDLRTGGPALMLGDCLAPTIILRYPGDTGLCPTCGEPVEEATAPGGGPMQAQMVGGVAYGVGVLIPCSHPIGAIDIEEPAGEAEQGGTP